MDKIELPLKVKCWRCEGTGQITTIVGEVKPGPDIPENLVGMPLYDFEPCDCDDGERFTFDDLAMAAIKANLLIGDPRKIGANWEISITEYLGGSEYQYGEGPTPTTALLMAIEKFNEEAK